VQIGVLVHEHCQCMQTQGLHGAYERSKRQKHAF
jgi:hypothetical protein